MPLFKVPKATWDRKITDKEKNIRITKGGKLLQALTSHFYSCMPPLLTFAFCMSKHRKMSKNDNKKELVNMKKIAAEKNLWFSALQRRSSNCLALVKLMHFCCWYAYICFFLESYFLQI